MCPEQNLPKKIFRKNESVVSRKIADETLLVPIRGHLADMQRIFSLNPVGEHIWDRLEGGLSLKEICSTIIDVFDVDQEKAETDTLEFIEQLLDADLIVEAE